MVAEIAELVLAVGVAFAIRRAHVRREKAENLGKGRLGPEHLVSALLGAELRHVLVRPRMLGELVALAVGAGDDLPVRLDVDASQEKGDFGSRLGQNVEKLVGQVAGAVIKGNCDDAGLRAFVNYFACVFFFLSTIYVLQAIMNLCGDGGVYHKAQGLSWDGVRLWWG